MPNVYNTSQVKEMKDNDWVTLESYNARTNYLQRRIDILDEQLDELQGEMRAQGE